VTRSAAQVRQDFIDFFRQRGHEIVPSSPVVPHDDPTLLFTNAGMNQFKPYFLGLEKPKYPRVANTQKCIRAGGKHNDLDDVGHDTYHHTFFEMLGNWSFGDYFKKEAIAWAWELLTKVWGLDKERLHATYFRGDPEEGLEPDYEARDLWASVTDIDPSHIHPGSKKDNFWEMGETGPCGPCSEIHIDLTPDRSGLKLVNAGDPRVIEIWNLVFIQFNRGADGKLTPLPARHVDTGMGFERVTALLQGKQSNYDTDLFVPIFDAIRDVTGAPPYGGTLPDPSRERAEPSRDRKGAGIDPSRERERAVQDAAVMRDTAYRVIADHIRCLTFAITDGAVPDKEGRGYVLRRILRRAVRYGWQYLNVHEPFLYKLVPTVADIMGDAFPELPLAASRVAEIICEEEESFERTLDQGIKTWWCHAASALLAARRDEEGGLKIWWSIAGHALWDQIIRESAAPHMVDSPDRLSLFPTDAYFTQLFAPNRDIMNPDTHIHIHRADGAVLDEFRLGELTRERTRRFCKSPPVIPGEAAFRLHDTYGFPIDLTQLMAEEVGLTVDIAKYERLMEEARERARAAPGQIANLIKRIGDLPPEVVSRFGGSDDSARYTAQSVEAEQRALLLLGLPTGTFKEADDGALVDGSAGAIVLDRTCFYAEQGGQVGDRGTIVTTTGVFEVTDTQRIGDAVFHVGRVTKGKLLACQKYTASLDLAHRYPTMLNHTATHLMNWALREVLGDHVQQKGSLVDPEKTRFDFSHPRPLTPEELQRVEELVNERIREQLAVHWQVVPQAEALRINGLRAVFGEKYPDEVRVVCCGVPIEQLLADPEKPEWRRYAIEFCGGTHVKNTAEIERFVITSEEAVAKGIRRVVAVTGATAQLVEETGAALIQRAEELKRTYQNPAREGGAPEPGPAVPGSVIRATSGLPAEVAAGLAELQKAIADTTLAIRHRLRLRELLAELQDIVKRQQKAGAADAASVVRERIVALLRTAAKIGNTSVVIAEMPDVPIEQLKHGADQIKQKCGSAAVLFGVHQSRDREGAYQEGTQARRHEGTQEHHAPGAPQEPSRDHDRASGKAFLLAALTNDLVKKGLKAGDWVKAIAPIVEGAGGGPPTMAQAGGKNPGKLVEALSAGETWIKQRLSS